MVVILFAFSAFLTLEPPRVVVYLAVIVVGIAISIFEFATKETYQTITLLMFIVNILVDIGVMYFVWTKLEEYKNTGAESLDH